MLIDQPVTRITSLAAYDLVMHMSDAVLSGGVRRSATICVFDKDDEAMLTAKTGDWFTTNPQRGRSNNSALIIRDELTRVASNSVTLQRLTVVLAILQLTSIVLVRLQLS